MGFGFDKPFWQGFQANTNSKLRVAQLYGDEKFLEKINFSYTENGSTVRADKPGFLAVAKATEEKRIGFTYNMAAAGVMGSVAEAVYDWRLNMIIVNSQKVGTKYGQSAVVHESTHALADLQAAQHFTRLSDESVAFLVQTMWLKAAGEPLPHNAVDPEHDRMFVEADTVATRHKLYDGTHVLLTRPDILALRTAVKKVYSHLGDEDRVLNAGVPAK